MKTLFSLLLIIFTTAFLAGCSISLVEKDQSAPVTALVPASPLVEEPGTGIIEDITTCVPPQKILNNECCLDADTTGVCDKYELQASCGDTTCSPSENECTCPADCGTCAAKDVGVCKAGVCENNVCVAKLNPQCCGDAVCKDGETCGTCFQDCCMIGGFSNNEKLNLGNFPGIAKGLSIVVGDKAPPEDVVIAEDILTRVASEARDVGRGMLASEISLGTKDYLIVGNPCDNAAAAELFKIDIFLNTNTPACQVFKPGQGLIKLFMTSDNHIALYVGGYSPFETKRAAQRLLDYKKNPLLGIEQKV